MIPGSKEYEEYVTPAQVRNDYFRTGVLGGVDEGIWNAGECEMLVDGSAPAVEFRFGPPTGETWVVKNVLTGLITAAAATAIEFGDLGAALANGVQFRLGNAVPEINNLAVLTTNGDFLKLGAPTHNVIGVAALVITATYNPDMPIILRGNDGEYLAFVVNDDLTAVASTTFWAMGRAYKYVG
jgi:hypothetical protein